MPEILMRTFAVACAALCASCASVGRSPASWPKSWTALGYLTPGASDDPDVIGEYADEAACRAAVEVWMSRQVVGNPVSGDCLPTDRL